MKIAATLVCIASFLVLSACTYAQRGHLAYAIEMLNECEFNEAVAAARDVRSSGPEDSVLAITSYLVEAYALDLLGSPDAEIVYVAYSLLDPDVADADEARKAAHESFAELTAGCL